MVTSTQLWFAIAMPSILALIGILLNLKGVTDLRAEMKADMKALEARVDARMARFEARLDSIEERLLKLIFDHEQRITRLETRTESK